MWVKLCPAVTSSHNPFHKHTMLCLISGEICSSSQSQQAVPEYLTDH